METIPSSVLSSPEKASGHHAFLFKHGTAEVEIERIVWTSFRNGNRKALDYIFEKYVRLMFVYGGKISRDQALVEDCIQDLFIELWNKRQIVADTTNIKYYLFKALRRKIVRRLSKDQRILSGQFKDTDYYHAVEFPIEFNIIQEQADHERESLLKKALADLSERQREAIYLKFYERLAYREIAGVLNVDVRSAYNLIGRAIDSLRQAIHTIYNR
ncbi:MAG TPA: sigma-70 family RNA polymerase sigma factor [Ohtaekwangia sp.]|nr:sigma-70 family RNA polymerase sigma factor [Ohtaekwangia sp.]